MRKHIRLTEVLPHFRIAMRRDDIVRNAMLIIGVTVAITYVIAIVAHGANGTFIIPPLFTALYLYTVWAIADWERLYLIHEQLRLTNLTR